jgi:hypothetical protein
MDKQECLAGVPHYSLQVTLYSTHDICIWRLYWFLVKVYPAQRRQFRRRS